MDEEEMVRLGLEIVEENEMDDYVDPTVDMEDEDLIDIHAPEIGLDPRLFGGLSLKDKVPPTLTGTDRVGKILDELEDIFKTQRLEVVSPDGFLHTPLHVVKQMSEAHGTKMHNEIFVMRFNQRAERIYRVEIYCGQGRGVGQAPLRGLAFQLAAIDMLEKMKKYNKEVELLPYGMPPGCRVNPQVMRDLTRICRANNLEDPLIEVNEKDKKLTIEESYLFNSTVTIGQFSMEAQSDNRFMAKRLAVKQMYDAIAKEPFPEMHLAMGHECVGLRHLKQMGGHPKISYYKRLWLEENRVSQSGKLIVDLEEEPDDGDFLDPADFLPPRPGLRR